MRVLTFIVGLLAALLAGVLTLLLGGELAGAATAAAVFVLVCFGAWFAGAVVRRLVLLASALLVAGSLAFGGWQTYQVSAGLLDTTGPVAAPDAPALAAVELLLGGVQEQSGFRIELTEGELTAIVQDGLRQVESPLRRVDLDFVAGRGGDAGVVRFRATFKSGSTAAEGTLAYALVAGGVEQCVESVSFGALKVPRVAQDALAELVERASELNQTLAEERVTVQALTIDDQRLVLVGTRGGGALLTSPLASGGLSARAAQAATPQPLPERLCPGTVDGREAPGSRWYVALGDSLAANVGVARPRDGYVSRLHRALSERDGVPYGLRNFAVPGENSGTILRTQLEQATAFMRGKDIAYVSLDIGANDLLPHLGSSDCADGVVLPACQSRVDASLAVYRGNLDALFRRVRAAVPQAHVLFLQVYNPFSFGFQGFAFEEQTDRVTQQLNAIAAEVAARHGVLVGDGYTPLRGRAATATHMTDSPPDIHPRATGYDALAAALLEAK
ncbi:MAG: SGNH/GDSL hydrolase family protein [Dehalococcoidia bacterium]|nr:SGNH/GDSL hydrolase family protein [Dehalococcoidia bacterium]